MGEWLPIESAPAETDVLVYLLRRKHHAIASQHQGTWYDMGSYVVRPDFWQPLPAPPK